ncbi:MAG: thioesterase domain-containing protein [Gammaproteobacteria bacterium]
MRARDDFTLPPPRILRAGLAGLPPWSPPRQGAEARLAEFFCAALNLDTVGADDDFFALGGNSLQAAAIFTRIQNDLGQRLPLATLYRSPTVRLLAGALEQAAAKQRLAPVTVAATFDDDCVQLIRAGSSAAPLFIAPGIGGDIVGLAHLARQLPPAQTVYGLRSVGLQEGEEPLAGVPAIAAAFVAGMRRVQPRGPYQLFGVCWGGLVVLEIARQLRDSGEQVRLMAMLDPPPVTAGGATPRDTGSKPAAPSTRRFIARRLELYRTALASRPLRDWPAYIGGRLANLADVLRRGDPFRGDPTEFLRWRVREANIQALRRYDPPPWSGDACLIFTSDRADGGSRAAREFWTRHLGCTGREVFVPGKDTGDALAPERAGALARVLAGRLAGPGS